MEISMSGKTLFVQQTFVLVFFFSSFPLNNFQKHIDKIQTRVMLSREDITAKYNLLELCQILDTVHLPSAITPNPIFYVNFGW